VSRKGRDDLSVDILDSATDVLRRCEMALRSSSLSDAGSIGADAAGFAVVLASRVVDSFKALRCYLGQVPQHRDEMLPNLCQNEGLVKLLVEWEKSWEIGARHVRDVQQLTALSHLAAGLRSVGSVAPAFTEMVGDCDPELFLSIPRVAWLHALAEPSGPVAPLLRRLLPHRFAISLEEAAKSGRVTAVQALVEAFQSAERCLDGAWPRGVGEASADGGRRLATWELFVRRAVSGAGQAEEIYGGLGPDQRVAAAAVVEGFMNELERWSMELQRHNPEDWNECVDLLVQCLTGARCEEAVVKFVV
jgi:hypothetical protein